jgi:myosin heavy subunit
MKARIKDMKLEIENKKNEIEALKRTIKSTKIQELESEIKQYSEETIRLRQVLAQAQAMRNASVNNQQSEMYEERARAQAALNANLRKEVGNLQKEVQFWQFEHQNMKASYENLAKELSIAKRQIGEKDKLLKQLRQKDSPPGNHHAKNTGVIDAKHGHNGAKPAEAKKVVKAIPPPPPPVAQQAPKRFTQERDHLPKFGTDAHVANNHHPVHTTANPRDIVSKVTKHQVQSIGKRDIRV